MNRIVERFARLQRDGKKAFVVYIGAGDPNLAATRQLALAFDKLGVDVLELGVPFSDPLADGLVNQLAAQRGVERFIQDAASAGVDGLLALDLPPEESDNYENLMRGAGMCNIYLVAPTTPDDRIEFIVKRGTGFIYYVSREGVTGMQKSVSETIAQMTAKIRAHTDLPVAVRFGISNADQVRFVAPHAEAIVVGSAIVNQIAACGQCPDLTTRVAEFAQPLAKALKHIRDENSNS